MRTVRIAQSYPAVLSDVTLLLVNLLVEKNGIQDCVDGGNPVLASCREQPERTPVGPGCGGWRRGNATCWVTSLPERAIRDRMPGSTNCQESITNAKWCQGRRARIALPRGTGPGRLGGGGGGVPRAAGTQNKR